jgi:hypothetical protein
MIRSIYLLHKQPSKSPRLECHKHLIFIIRIQTRFALQNISNTVCLLDLRFDPLGDFCFELADTFAVLLEVFMESSSGFDPLRRIKGEDFGDCFGDPSVDFSKLRGVRLSGTSGTSGLLTHGIVFVIEVEDVGESRRGGET